MWYEAKREFIEAAARVMWADAWAGWQESHCIYCGEDVAEQKEFAELCGEHSARECRGASFSGQDLTEVAPPTPQYALYEAAGLLARLEVANGAGLATILANAGEADCIKSVQGDMTHPHIAGHDCEAADAADFGGNIALQALGHGAGWFDDHARFELKVPHVEFSYEEGQE